MTDKVSGILDDLKVGIDKTYETLRRDLSKIPTGQASVRMLDSIRVDYYGESQPINQVATITILDSQSILIRPISGQTDLRKIDNAIRSSNLGLNLQSSITEIRISVPAITEDRRRETYKLLIKYGDDCKLTIRQQTRKANDLIEQLARGQQISGDDATLARKQVEALGAEVTRKVNEEIEAKQRALSC